jgi:predicted permease
MHVPLLRGRDVDDSDVAGRPGAVLISESMAKSLWPNEDAIGKHLTLYFFPELPRVVVGVVGDVKMNAMNEKQPAPTLYFPVTQMSVPRGETWRSFGMKVAVRTNAAPLSVAPAIAGAIREIDEEVPLLNIRTMDDSVSASLSQARFTMLLLGAFAGLALLLAVVGIYSVMSFAVSRRTNEIGIRVALGASRSNVLVLIVRQALVLALIGSVIGIVGALSLSRLMASQLYGVRPTDPVTFITVAALLMMVSLVASYIPAQRAMRVDPMIALRYE